MPKTGSPGTERRGKQISLCAPTATKPKPSADDSQGALGKQTSLGAPTTSTSKLSAGELFGGV